MVQCLFAGVGGQGIVLASKLTGTHFMNQGYHVRTTETIGMAQRGGSVTSHLRASKDPVYSPFVIAGKLDLLIALEPAEAVRNLKYLGENTKILVHTRPIKPVTDTLAKESYDPSDSIKALKNACPAVYVFDFQDLFEELGSDKVLNLAMLGAAIGLSSLPTTKEDMILTIREMIPERFLKMNLKAYETGFEKGQIYHRGK
ncbi:MAG: indolepyruvate oxidoreductase subunit beta [Tissierellia bacterium]|nr:indolepyruvate oxidoreductase subunit beta [Tissierellia bacterium]